MLIASSRLCTRPGLAMAIAVLAAMIPASARAATITVTTTADTIANDGNCSIREAIINANNDAATWGDCAAGSGVDTINLPAGTITFAIANPPSSPANLDGDQVAAAGDLDLLTSMTINGDPAGTTIDANLLDRVFDINPDVDGLPETVTPAIAVQITSVTMTRARQNQSGAVRVLARAAVTMDRCTVSNSISWADDGGGIFVFPEGALTLVNSTVSGNFALLHGGGVRVDGALTMTSSTITGNSSSFANLIQGLWCAGPVCNVRNSIIAGNGPAPRADTGGIITSLGYNIIGKTTDDMGNPITSVTATTGDQFNVGAAPVDLQALANNGGPTPTHALGPASIALDQGESSGLTADQRGLVRPCDLAAVANAADGADIGAFEQQGVCFSNAPPDAVDDAATVEVNSGATTIDVLANDSDPDADALAITAVTQGANGAVINNGTSVSYTPAPGFIGTDTFTYTIDDGHGETDTATVTVTVDDTTPPVVTASVADHKLWPPNHQMVNVGLSVSAVDNSGGPVTFDVEVFSDEDDLAPGSGHFSPDATHIAPGTLKLRAERSGYGNGRVYLIVVAGSDSSGNVGHACAAVVVPHSLSVWGLWSVFLQAHHAQAYCEANGGAAPPGYVLVGDGPVKGPKPPRLGHHGKQDHDDKKKTPARGHGRR